MKTTFFLFIAILIATPVFSESIEVTGKASDPSGAVIPGASVVITDSANSIAATATTGNDGTFTLQVAPGSYTLNIAANGFDDYAQPVTVASNTPPLSVTLAVGKLTQEIDVQDDPNLITLDPENNQTALVLKEDDIQSLPDDEEDMIAYLTELAGPRAAAAGGVQFIIDGFQGGRLPPKGSDQGNPHQYQSVHDGIQPVGIWKNRNRYASRDRQDARQSQFQFAQ